MEAKEHKQTIDASNFIDVQTRSTSNRDEKQRYNVCLQNNTHMDSYTAANDTQDSVTQIGNSFENLLDGEDPLGRSLQEKQPRVGDEERMTRKQRKNFMRMKRARKHQKVALRREKVEQGIMVSRDKALRDSMSILSNGEASSSISRNDTGLSVSEGQMVMYGETTQFFHGSQKMRPGFSNQGGYITSYEPEMKVEEDIPYVSDWQMKAEELRGVTVKTETHNKPYAEKGDEMDVEMSGRIAKLGM